MNKKLDKILAEISAGELIDKITILEIKKIKISDAEKLKDINKELDSLNQTFKQFIPDPSSIQQLIDKLKSINLKLWDIENGKRQSEKDQNFGKEFIELARSVYKSNDERAKIKRMINKSFGSELIEEKSYTQYSL